MVSGWYHVVGGWVQGEQQGAIVHYLLEEYNNLEYCYGDMLSPKC
jgi:hypothetical protein